MARVAAIVCGEIGRDRQPNAAIDRGSVTTRAAALRTCRAVVVLRVIKFHIEWFVEGGGKVLQRWIITACVRVADDAHRDLRRCELAAVTISARFVTREAWSCRVVCAFVTRVATERAVFLTRVQEFGVVAI